MDKRKTRDMRPAHIRVWGSIEIPPVANQLDVCWRWTGTFYPSGHGQISVNGVTMPAYRYLYELEIGYVPEGKELDHLCRNRWCVNPHHLEPVTSRENTLRGIGPTAQNARKTHCLNGHPFDEANTYLTPTGKRSCRKCKAAASRLCKQRKKADTSREDVPA